ncbi:MAG TPA: hypothetical protein DDZ51_16420, partial [Planctomycetaceae bacterium]|nr:hypothetical protein [Planctomycetaceae bacterium]
VAAGGSVARVDFNGNVQSYIDNSQVTARDIDLQATSTPQGVVYGWGVNAGALAVGVSMATLNINPIVATSIDGNLDARSLSSTALLGLPLNGVTSVARTTGSSGGLIGVDSTNSVVNNNASVSSTIGTGSTLNVSGETSVVATGLGVHTVNADSYAFGLLAAGISSARVNNQSGVAASIGNDVAITGGSLFISADNSQSQFADTFAGSGGIAAGASASSTTINNGTSLVSIGDGSSIDLSDDLNINNFGNATVNGRVQTFAGGLLAGAGASVDNTVNAITRTTIGNNVSIDAMGIRVDTSSSATKPELSTENIRGTTGGLIAGASARSETNVTFDTQIFVGNGATLNVFGLLENPGAITLSTLNSLFARDKVNFTTGGALSGASADSIVRNDANVSQVNIGASATLTSLGDILLSARGTGDVQTTTNAETFGVATVVTADSISEITPHNTVNVGAGATLRASGDLNLAAGTSIDFSRDQYSLSARTDTFAGSAIPSESIDSQANLFQYNTINVAAGALLESVRDIRLHAERLGLAKLRSKAKAVNWASAASGELNSALGGQEVFGGSINSQTNGIVNVLGTLRTGIQRHQELILGAIGADGVPYGWDPETGAINVYWANDGITFNVGSEILESGLMQQLDAARINLELYRTTDITLRNFYQSEINRIQNELISKGFATLQSDGSLTADEVEVMTVNVDPIWAQAGIIDVRASRLIGNGIIDAPSDASVTVTNHTPAQLNILGITIPESNGG